MEKLSDNSAVTCVTVCPPSRRMSSTSSASPPSGRASIRPPFSNRVLSHIVYWMGFTLNPCIEQQTSNFCFAMLLIWPRGNMETLKAFICNKTTLINLQWLIVF